MKLLNGDCLEVLKTLESDSVDSLVTDPPAGISFMGKAWDSDKGGRQGWVTWMTSVMQECHRVLKPGAHGLIWAIPRTSHWTATALEDAGFEVRDVITHLFGQGFPKSLDISKAIDKGAGATRKVVPRTRIDGKATGRKLDNGRTMNASSVDVSVCTPHPVTASAKQWEGWGTALKPASEHWILVRKPISEKNVAANVLKWGVGGINIDGSRIDPVGMDPRVGKGISYDTGETKTKFGQVKSNMICGNPSGRFPANLVLSHSEDCEDDQCSLSCAVKALDEQSGVSKSAPRPPTGKPKYTGSSADSAAMRASSTLDTTTRGHADSGGASRFFFQAKWAENDNETEWKNPANSAELPSNLGTSLDASAQRLAAIGAALADKQLRSTTVAFTSEMQSKLKKPGNGNTLAILSIGRRYLQELRHIERSSRSPAKVAEARKLTDITRTILDLLTCNGSAEPATSNITPQNSELGAKDLSLSRFIYCAKISSRERNEGLEGMPMHDPLPHRTQKTEQSRNGGPRQNHHPTVKPKKLMSYLIRMITPPGGVVLDPFMGSGSTGLAAKECGFKFVGIEKEPEYFEIASKRVAQG
jgi:hypothetical protein